MMTTLLETSGLQKSFGAVVAAKDISVAARSGERLGLIGNNGAGKTTFINLVTGYLRPDAGRIIIDGENIAGLEPRRIRRHGVSRSFQIPQLFANLTPEENSNRARDHEYGENIILAARPFDRRDGCSRTPSGTLSS